MSAIAMLRSLTQEEVDRLRFTIWKHFGKQLQPPQHAPDELLLDTVDELMRGQKTCPQDRLEPTACLLSLIVAKMSARIADKRQEAAHLLTEIRETPVETIREELRAFGCDLEAMYQKIEESTGVRLLTQQLKDWIMKILWTPQWAGQEVTAADISKQTHRFITDEGDISLECYWEKATSYDPAYIWLSWQADLKAEKELHLLFLNPETRGIYHQVNLKKILAGEETFTSEELGFDPVGEPWALAVMLREVEA